MSDPSAGEIGGIFAGLVTSLGLLGGAVSWLVGWKERREETRAAKLLAWEKRLDERETRYQGEIEARLTALTRGYAMLGRQNAALGRAYQTIATRLRSIDPYDPALQEADRVLREAFPVDHDTPAEMLALLGQMDGTKPA